MAKARFSVKENKVDVFKSQGSKADGRLETKLKAKFLPFFSFGSSLSYLV